MMFFGVGAEQHPQKTQHLPDREKIHFFSPYVRRIRLQRSWMNIPYLENLSNRSLGAKILL
jgi:hypothetical protein